MLKELSNTTEELQKYVTFVYTENVDQTKLTEEHEMKLEAMKNTYEMKLETMKATYDGLLANMETKHENELKQQKLQNDEVNEQIAQINV